MNRPTLSALITGALLSTFTPPVLVAQATPHPAPRKPNLLVIALDDVGFADLGAFGSEIRTPAIDSIAAHGLRYTNFQTNAICSPTRAALMTGRNPHTVGMADLPDQSRPDPTLPPNRTGVIPANAEMLAEALHRQGYATFAFGKWHLTPRYQDGTPGNNSTFPLQRGFDSFYGYKLGWTDQYHPTLIDGNTPIPDPYHPGYYLAEDLAEHAIAAMQKSQAADPAKPMFVYLAFSFAHTPTQAPPEYIAHYKDTYSKGWDALREERFAREKKLGIIPADTRLPPREKGDPAWASLTPQQRRIYARFMATYAGFIEHGDAQIGKVLAYLHATGLDKNTTVVLFSDNGAASERKTGSFRHAYEENPSLDDMDKHLDELGSVTTQPLYQRAWAYAGCTPFRRYKLWPFFGGTRTPMLIDSPGNIPDPGGLRTQMVDVIDLAPTLLALAGTRFAATLDGVPQIPVAGRSILATMQSPNAPAPRTTQFFELRGNRAILAGDWRALAVHKLGTPFPSDTWQLFDLKHDPAESTNVATRYPAKLKELQALWQTEAQRYGALPLQEKPNEKAYADAFAD